MKTELHRLKKLKYLIAIASVNGDFTGVWKRDVSLPEASGFCSWSPVSEGLPFQMPPHSLAESHRWQIGLGCILYSDHRSKNGLTDRTTFYVNTQTTAKCRTCQRMVISVSGWLSALPAALLQKALSVFPTVKAVLTAGCSSK